MHNLEQSPITGEYAMVAARRIPWHRLGDWEADRLITLDEALERGHLLNWNVRPFRIVAVVEPTTHQATCATTRDGACDCWTPADTLVIDDKVAAVRDNPWVKGQVDYLGTVGSGIAQFQNEQMAEFAGALIDAVGTDECVSAAGSIQGGRRTFITLEMPEEMIVADAKHRTFLAALTSHDGSMSLTTAATMTNVVCQNTFDAVVRGNDPKHKIRHRGDMAGKVQEAREHLGLTWKWAEAYKQEMEGLATQRLTDKAFQKLIAANFVEPVTPKDGPRTENRKKRDTEVLTYLWRESPTTEAWRGTKLAALNAVTEWAEWGRPGDLSTPKAAVSNLFGTPATIRAKAVKVLATK